LNSLIVGIDEAGRGPLAGPLIVAAVKMYENTRIDGVKDSKKLKPADREALFDIIIKECLMYDIEVIHNSIIDNINILQATMLGMEFCLKKLYGENDTVFIDGNYFKFSDGSHKRYNYTTVVGGDDKIFQISCASILAKVARDRIMVGMSGNYPEFNFEQNKGYPTKEHITAIKKAGISKIHRKTFCIKFIKD